VYRFVAVKKVVAVDAPLARRLGDSLEVIEIETPDKALETRVLKVLGKNFSFEAFWVFNLIVATTKNNNKQRSRSKHEGGELAIHSTAGF
jgi:hypothetical protein